MDCFIIFLAMFYLNAFVQSLYNIEWLGNQKKQIAKGFAYVVLLALVLSGVYSLYLMREIPNMVREGMTYLETEIPEVTATVAAGKLSIEGLDQPFSTTFEDDGQTFLIYIDTQAAESVALADVVDIETESAILVTDSAITFHQAGVETETQYVKEFPDFVLSKADVVNWGNIIAGGLPLFFFFLFWTVLFFAFVAWKIVYLLVISFVAWGIGKIGNKAWSFEDIYAVGLFALTLPSVITFIPWAFFGLDIPYAYTVIMLAVLSIVMWQKPQHHNPLDALKDAWK